MRLQNPKLFVSALWHNAPASFRRLVMHAIDGEQFTTEFMLRSTSELEFLRDSITLILDERKQIGGWE